MKLPLRLCDRRRDPDYEGACIMDADDRFIADCNIFSLDGWSEEESIAHARDFIEAVNATEEPKRDTTTQGAHRNIQEPSPEGAEGLAPSTQNRVESRASDSARAWTEEEKDVVRETHARLHGGEK